MLYWYLCILCRGIRSIQFCFGGREVSEIVGRGVRPRSIVRLMLDKDSLDSESAPPEGRGVSKV